MVVTRQVTAVSEAQQVLFMQVRMIRQASEKWKKPVDTIAELFAKYHVFQYIEECFGIFHMEGDEVVLQEVENYLKSKESVTSIEGTSK